MDKIKIIYKEDGKEIGSMFYTQGYFWTMVEIMISTEQHKVNNKIYHMSNWTIDTFNQVLEINVFKEFYCKGE